MNYWNLKRNENVNVLLIVAHPDDETIFCGGTMLTYPNWNWNIVCVTHKNGTERYKQFSKAIKYYKKAGVKICSFQTLSKNDTNGDMDKKNIHDWEKAIKNLDIVYDLVITHNTKGEYGHAHHVIVNNIVNKLFVNVWEFICPGSLKVSPQPFKNDLIAVPLTQEILDMKTKIFNESYCSEMSLWKEISGVMVYEFKCGPEIFTGEIKNT